MSRRGRRRACWAGLTVLGTAVVAVLCWHAFIADRQLQLFGTLQWTGEGRPGPVADQWHIELAASPDEAARVSRAALTRPSGNLDVDLILTCGPTRKFRGKVVPDAGNRLMVRLHQVNGDIPEQLCVPAEECVRGLEVRALIRMPD
jgi:hypothetical protein